jgi:hypothetical protein
MTKKKEQQISQGTKIAPQNKSRNTLGTKKII